MKIASEVLAVLCNCTFDGPRLMLPPGQLDRKLYDAVNKVLEANGGKWNRSSKAHVFGEDAADAVEQAILTGEFRRVKQDLGQFDTPAEVVAIVIAQAEISAGMRVLEPSAGIGNIAMAAIEQGADLETIEMDPKRAAALVMRIARSELSWAKAAVGRKCDFLDTIPEPIFDRVVMNPPFAKQADIDHVTHALKFLAGGGRLVAIMSAAVKWRTNRKTAEFLALIGKHDYEIVELPEQAFAESGTMVKTVLVTVQT